MATTAATTFGRRGATPSPPGGRPSARQEAPRQTAHPARFDPPAAPPSRSEDSMLRIILRIFFSFQGRLDRGMYRMCRSLWYLVTGLAFYAVWSCILQAGRSHQLGAAALWLLVMLVLLFVGEWNTLAMQVKRWHDRDKSGFWVLITFIPVVGPIWSLVEMVFLDGTVGPNRFGPSPRGDPSTVFA